MIPDLAIRTLAVPAEVAIRDRIDRKKLKAAQQPVLLRNADFVAHNLETDELLVRIEQIRRTCLQQLPLCSLIGSGSIIAHCSNLYKSTAGVNNLALVIYTKPGCPYCQQARDYYNSKGIPFSTTTRRTIERGARRCSHTRTAIRRFPASLKMESIRIRLGQPAAWLNGSRLAGRAPAV